MVVDFHISVGLLPGTRKYRVKGDVRSIFLGGKSSQVARFHRTISKYDRVNGRKSRSRGFIPFRYLSVVFIRPSDKSVRSKFNFNGLPMSYG